jgi:predicted nuclease of predicted toxin-antitoxin system
VVSKIADIFPNVSHVMLKHLDESTDLEVWRYARQNGFAIVTKDSDFNELAISRGSPPKIIWIKLGNCKVNDIAHLLRDNKQSIIEFLENELSVILEIHKS